MIDVEKSKWMKAIFSYPESAEDSLTSGNSTAIMPALTISGDYNNIKGDLIPESVIYLNTQVFIINRLK